MNTQKIKLNLIPGGIPPIVHVSQYDVGRPLAFELYDGMSAATIEAGTVVDIRATKPDGTGFEYACTWTNNVVSIATQVQMTVLAGQIECELHLVKNQQEIGTANFILEVEEAALRADTDISETELPDIIDLARSHEQAAAASAEAAAESEGNAADSASAAATSESNAADSASAAATSESNAADSASAAATSESNASDSETAAANSATAAAGSATAAANSKSDAEAYAVGKRGGVDVPSTDPTYNNNAKHYSEVAQQAAAGGIIPKGTTTFAQLPALADSQVGDMWNISDAFVTTADFREGAGSKYGAGANVYKTSDNKWDVTGGQRVTMTGATSSTDGTAGELPAPLAGQENATFFGDGTWKTLLYDALMRYENGQGKIPSISSGDLNSITTNDIKYVGPLVLNVPVSDWGLCLSFVGTTGNLIQLWVSLNGDTSQVKSFNRTYCNGYWSEWIRVDDRDLIADAWARDTEYEVEDLKIWENKLYRCKIAHTSSVTLTPANSTYWESKKISDLIKTDNLRYSNTGVEYVSGEASKGAGWNDAVFIFNNVKPGKYLLYATVNLDNNSTTAVVVVYDGRSVAVTSDVNHNYFANTGVLKPYTVTRGGTIAISARMYCGGSVGRATMFLCGL